MLAYIKSFFYGPEIDRNTQLNNCLKDLGPLNNMIKKYDYFFQGKVVKDFPLDREFMNVSIDGNNIILFTKNRRRLFIDRDQEFITIFNSNYQVIGELDFLYKMFLSSLPDNKISLYDDENLFISDFNESMIKLDGTNRNIIKVIAHKNIFLTISTDNLIKVWTLEGQLLKTIVCPDIASNTIITQNKIVTRFYYDIIHTWDLQNYDEEIIHTNLNSSFHISDILIYGNKIIYVTDKWCEICDLKTKIYKIKSSNRRSNVIICDDYIIYLSNEHILFYIDDKCVYRIKINITPKRYIYPLNIIHGCYIKIHLLPNKNIFIYDSNEQIIQIYDFDGHRILNKKVSYFSDIHMLYDGRIIGIGKDKIEVLH